MDWQQVEKCVAVWRVHILEIVDVESSGLSLSFVTFLEQGCMYVGKKKNIKLLMVVVFVKNIW